MIDFKNLLDPVLIILILIFTGFSIYIYRVTNPPVPKKIKHLLTAVRSLALILLMLAIFNSVVGLTKSEMIAPVNLFFIDNSKSVGIKDSARKMEITNRFISDLSGNNSNRFYLFGSRIDSFKNREVTFTDKSTSFSDIEKFITSQSLNISSVTILSDGILTDGANPIYGFEKLSIPVFTIGIGDTTGQNDVVIHEPRYNELIYRKRLTTIEAGITSTGFSGKDVTVKLYEEENFIEQKSVLLSGSGQDNVKFNYIPKSVGDKRLRIEISPLKNEGNKNNNSKSFIVKVFNDRIKTLLISSSPSADVSIIAGVLSKEERVRLKTIVELAGNKTAKGGNSDFPADSADVFIMVGYPSKNSDNTTYNQIKSGILQKNKPFIVSVGSSTDFNRLGELNSLLPFSFTNSANSGNDIEVYSDNAGSPLIKQSDSRLWASLPPVKQLNMQISPGPGSQVILKAKIKNIQTDLPVVITRQINAQKSAAIIAEDFWKWKLQSGSQTEYLFDNLISNILQWLNTPSEKKLFSIKSGKKVYLDGEKIEITGQLYDNLFNPVENADIKLKVKSKSQSYETILPNSGNGVYSAELENLETGNLKITAGVKLNNTTYSDSITLFIDKNDLERINTKMDTGFLKQISFLTKGDFFNIDDYSGLKSQLEELSGKNSSQLKEYSEFRFAENKIILIILIILFVFEWFVRKTYRLI